MASIGTGKPISYPLFTKGKQPGRFNNILLAQTVTLALNLKLDPALAGWHLPGAIDGVITICTDKNGLQTISADVVSRVVDDHLELKALGPAMIRGKEQPIEVYTLG